MIFDRGIAERLILRKMFGGLPSNYTPLVGITIANTRFVITDFYLTGDDTLKFSFKTEGNGNIIGCYDSNDTTKSYSFYATTSSTGKYLRYDGGTYSSYSLANKQYDVVISPTGSSGVITPSTWEPKSFTALVPLSIGATSPTGVATSGTSFYGPIEVVGRAKFIPCLDEDNDVCYYDLYSKTAFYTDDQTKVTAITE